MLYIVYKLYLLLPGLSRRFDHLVGARLVLFPSSCSPIISGKLTEAFPFIPSGYEIASKIDAWGYLYPHPISTTKVNTS